MHKKLIAVLIGLALFLGGGMAGANDEQKAVTTNENAPAASVKCWKRTWVSSEALMGRSTMPVCKAFEKVLNATCEPPEKLQCNWTLPFGENKFKKLGWQPLDPQEHWSLIKDIVLSGWNEKYRAGKWEFYEPEYKKDLAEGRLKLSISKADIDHDGKEEQIVLFSKRSCPEIEWKDIYGVIQSDEKECLDRRFRNLLGDVNATMGAEIMLYEDKAYLFGWEEVPGRIVVYDGFNLLPNSEDRGSINICQFQYLKGGKIR
jgi:hypothetical protein